MELFAHHTQTHALGIKEVALFATVIFVALLVIKVVGVIK